MDFTCIAWYFFSLLRLLSIAKFDQHVTLVVDKAFEWTANAYLSLWIKQCIHRRFGDKRLHPLAALATQRGSGTRAMP